MVRKFMLLCEMVAQTRLSCTVSNFCVGCLDSVTLMKKLKKFLNRVYFQESSMLDSMHIFVNQTGKLVTYWKKCDNYG